MKSIFKYIYTMTLGVLLLNSCTSDLDKVSLNTKDFVASEIDTYPTANLVLLEANAASTIDTLKWSKADFGYSAGVDYDVTAALAGSDTYKTLTTVKGITYWAPKVSDFNLNMQSLGCKGGVATPVKFRVVAKVSSNYTITSDTIGLNVTVYDAGYLTLYVTGAYSGWNQDAGDKLYSKTSNDIYFGYVNFTDVSAFKLCTQNSWAGTNYGGSVSKLDPAGGDITDFPGSPAYYYIKTDLNTLKLDTVFRVFTLGLIGSAVPTGWDSQTNLTYNASTKKWEGKIAMTQGGEFKVRINADWNKAYGAGSADGFLADFGQGGNITFSLASGTYTVAIDLSGGDAKYEFTAAE